MARRTPAAPGVRRGEVYRSKGRRGWYRLRVKALKGFAGGRPYALLVEIQKDGRPMRGLDRHGMPRCEPFVSMLVFRDRAWHLNNFYTLEELTR